jgi:hypothetical protein
MQEEGDMEKSWEEKRGKEVQKGREKQKGIIEGNGRKERGRK